MKNKSKVYERNGLCESLFSPKNLKTKILLKNQKKFLIEN